MENQKFGTQRVNLAVGAVVALAVGHMHVVIECLQLVFESETRSVLSLSLCLSVCVCVSLSVWLYWCFHKSIKL